MHAGVATHFVPSASVSALHADVAATLSARTHWAFGDATAAVSLALNRHAVPLPEFSISQSQLSALKSAFSQRSVAEVAATLHASAKAASRDEDILDAAFLGKAAKALDHASPTSLRVTFEQLRRGAALPTLAACLAMELRVAMHFMTGGNGDFYEGVRAALVDKDGKPNWSPAPHSQSAVDAYFAPLHPPTRELSLA